MFNVAPTLKVAEPPANVGVRPALWLKPLTVIEEPPLASVAVVGKVIEYVAPVEPVTLKAAALGVPPKVPAPPVVVKPLVVVNTAVPAVVVDAVTVPKLIGVVWLIAMGVAIVALASPVTLAAFATPEKATVARARAEAIFKVMFILNLSNYLRLGASIRRPR